MKLMPCGKHAGQFITVFLCRTWGACPGPQTCALNMFSAQHRLIRETMDDSPQNVYAKYLPKHRGYPLWLPQPSKTLPLSHQRDGFQIGDVGIVHPERGFEVLFNVCLPPTHALHINRDIPTFDPIVLKDEDIFVNSDAVIPGSVISSGVTRIFSPSDASSRYVFSKGQWGRMDVERTSVIALNTGSLHPPQMARFSFSRTGLHYTISYPHASFATWRSNMLSIGIVSPPNACNGKFAMVPYISSPASIKLVPGHSHRSRMQRLVSVRTQC